jgi:aryl-alcohol dehydrogenase-like predicted oxidoreductase
MTRFELDGRTNRRSFLQTLALLGIGGRALLRSGDAKAAVYAARAASGTQQWPELGRRTLGRTGFEGSRLVFGCGAALSRGRKDDLLEAAFDAGINVFDSGTRRYYRDAEVNLAPFVKQHRDQIFLISKAMTYLEVEPEEEITSAQGRQAAATWTGLLEQSLRELEVEFVDAYYLMAAHNPHIVRNEELRAAFEQAKQAGKVRHIGLSTHQNAQRVLEAAMETGGYDLAQVAVTPAGWYDWQDKSILAGSAPMTGLRPFLDQVRESGIGLIGMKAGRYLAGRKFLGWGKPDAFDEHYDAKFLASGLSPFQRSYAYVLAHGLDAVNADMQAFGHLEENVAAAATAEQHFA